jgi:hypothetical protein
MSRVLLHDQYIGSAKVFSENKEKLELLIKSAERDQGIFQDSAVDFYNVLLFVMMKKTVLMKNTLKYWNFLLQLKIDWQMPSGILIRKQNIKRSSICAIN